MANRLTIEYDQEGDILYVDFVQPYREQESDTIADMVVARMNPVTGRVENLEILCFLQTARAGESVDIPVDADLMPVWPEIDASSPPAPPERRSRAAS